MLPGEQLPVATDDIGGVHHQRMKVGYGANGAYADVAPAAALPTGPGYLEASGTIAANGAVAFTAVDVSAYRWAQVQVLGTWTGTLRFSASMDGTNWLNVHGGQIDFPSNIPTTQPTNGLWGVPLGARYFRVVSSAWTSGTATVVAGFSAAPSYAGWTQLISGATSNTITDDASGFMEMKTGALGMVFDGTTWDRVRSATILDATAGTGLPGAGLIGWDGSLYRRVRVDANGYLQTERVPLATATSGKTSVTTAGTRVQLPSTAGSGVIVKASRLNASTVYVGGSAVAASNGLELDPGESMNAAVSNTNLLYVDAAVSGDFVTWLVVA
jgi:hypothetical protein